MSLIGMERLLIGLVKLKSGEDATNSCGLTMVLMLCKKLPTVNGSAGIREE